jgi:hypothetical protein
VNGYDIVVLDRQIAPRNARRLLLRRPSSVRVVQDRDPKVVATDVLNDGGKVINVRELKDPVARRTTGRVRLRAGMSGKHL